MAFSDRFLNLFGRACRARRFVFLFQLILTAGCVLCCGCSREKKVEKRVETAPAIPSAPAREQVLDAWKGLTNETTLARTVIRSESGRMPVPRLVAPGTIALPVAFTGEKPPSRASWDFKLPLDLSQAPALQFDFYCENLDLFTHFSCYFKSGNGWYHATFSPEENGQWERMTIGKAGVETEGKPEGWGKISQIRISGWRTGVGETVCALANVSVVHVEPDVAVVYADSLAAKGGAEKKSYLHYAETMASSLRAAGVEPLIVADTDLTDATLQKMKAVILPYNPQMPKEKVALLRAAAGRGMRILACYSQCAGVTSLLGVKLGGTRPKGGHATIAGFERVGPGLAGQPAFAPQSSWIAFEIKPSPHVVAVANWRVGAKEQPLGAALVQTPTGLYMGHVWLGGADESQLALIRSIVCDLSPALKAQIDARAAAQREQQQKMADWIRAQPSKAGEVRAFWCHSAWGLGGGRTWDDSIRFLKANGCNAIIANLCWGGVASYPSTVLPVSGEVAKKGDAFDLCQRACRQHGVKMHVWKVCWNMGHATDASFVKKMQDAGRTQMDVNGKARERWLCPSHPDNQVLEINAMVELAKKRPDGIHFDYIRYPGSECCFCTNCRARFEAQIGHAVTNWPADVRGKGCLHEAWTSFRVGNITKVVREVSQRVRREAPGVQISAAVFTNPSSVAEEIAQDWPGWCREGLLDFVCPMDYTDSRRSFASMVKAQRQAAGGVKVYPGLGLSCWHDAARDGEKFTKQLQKLRELGLDGFTVFNFDRRAERGLPILRTGPLRLD